MHIAVVGCTHGELDKIYEVVENIEKQREFTVSLVVCCGDFQSVRNMTDLRCMARPLKYQQMHDFHRYYSGEKKAPILTIFIGGNHEASNFLQELPYGGWVAPNIFYMGYSGVFKFGHIRIAGISGIYKMYSYNRGRFESPPYDQDTMRSVYHYRNLDIFRLKQLRQPMDIILSHDWPNGIHRFGNTEQLLIDKPHLREQIEKDDMGSQPLFDVLEKVQPGFWFSAHMHVKFPARVVHSHEVRPAQEQGTMSGDPSMVKELNATKFLALSKLTPGEEFLQIVEIPSPDSLEVLSPKLEYDAEWLAILKSTNHLISRNQFSNAMPGENSPRFEFTPTDDELAEIGGIFEDNFIVPNNFSQTGTTYSPEDESEETASPIVNPQTREFCQKLGITDPLELLATKGSGSRLGVKDTSVTS